MFPVTVLKNLTCFVYKDAQRPDLPFFHFISFLFNTFFFLIVIILSIFYIVYSQMSVSEVLYKLKMGLGQNLCGTCEKLAFQLLP